MARSSQQAKKDLINVQRLLRRLEETSREGDAEADRDYFRTLSTLSGIKYARTLLDRASDNSTPSKTHVLTRLDRLEEHYKSLHQSTQPPKRTKAIEKSDLEALRPKVASILLPEEAILTDATLERTLPDNTAAQDTVADNLLPLETEDDSVEKERRLRRHSSAHSGAPPSSITPSSTLAMPEGGKEPTRSSSSSSNNNTTQSLTTLLSHHRSEQETLTEELAQMASRLKANSLQFSDLLANDKAVMEEAEQKLEGNLAGMTKERDRLKGYSKKGGVTTWFVIGAVIAVMMAWMFMFGLMRVL